MRSRRGGALADRSWNPFLYPQARHRRTESPPKLGRYPLFKPYLRRDFFGRCVYCCKPDGLDPQTAHFHVEHYRPKQVFPAQELDYDNLYYACGNCNGRKGTFWPTDADLANGRWVANPCEHVMIDHLKFDRLEVQARSKAGTFMVERLDLNMSEAVSFRSFVLSSVRDNLRRRNRCRNTLTKLVAKRDSSNAPIEILRLSGDIAKVAAEVDSSEGFLRRLLGGVGPLPD